MASTSSEMERNTAAWPRHVWWPIPLVLTGLFILASFDLQRSHEPYWLLPLLNIGILFLGGLLGALLADLGYIAGGQKSVLLLGTAMFTFGWGSLAAALLVPRGMVNAAVTVYNLSALIMALLHLHSALDLWLPRHKFTQPSRMDVTAFYGISLLVMALLTFLSLNAYLPRFITVDGASTPLRHLVSMASISILLATACLFLVQGRRSGSSFIAWYWCGLTLIAIGLTAVAITPLGTALCWKPQPKGSG